MQHKANSQVSVCAVVLLNNFVKTAPHTNYLKPRQPHYSTSDITARLLHDM